MASSTQWTWVWWWTGRPAVLHSMGSQRVGHDWVTELNCLSDLVPWICFLFPLYNCKGFPLGLIDFIFLLSKGLKRVFSSTTVWEHQFFGPQHSHLCSFHDGSEGKESACNAGDPGSIPQSERHSGEGNGNPLWNLAGEAHGQRSLVGYSPWGHRESDRTEELTLSLPFSHILTWLVEKQIWLYGPLLTKWWLYFLICPLGCRQESLRRNWGEIRVQNAVLGCNLKNDWMISVRFQGKPFNITVIQVYAPNQ